MALRAGMQRVEVLFEPEPVAELGEGVGAGLPGEVGVQLFELAAVVVQLVVQGGDAFGGDEPGLDQERIDGLDEEIIGTGLHALEHVGPFAHCRRDDRVRVAVGGAGANPPAQLGPVDARHHPVGDEHVDRPRLQEEPGLVAVDGDETFVSESLHDRFHDESRRRFVVGDQHPHVSSPRLRRRAPRARARTRPRLRRIDPTPCRARGRGRALRARRRSR